MKRPRLTPVADRPNGLLRLNISDDTGRSNIVERTTALGSNAVWQSVQTIFSTNLNVPTVITMPFNIAPQAFHRVRLQTNAPSP